MPNPPFSPFCSLEGMPILAKRRATPLVVEVSPESGEAEEQLVRDLASASAAGLASACDRFAADFAGGRMGKHHNTFQHRSRLLRQWAARLVPPGH